MNLRFRRRLKIIPGLWLNFNKGMPSISMGQGPFTLNVSRKGIRGTAALHGTGLSINETIPWSKIGRPRVGHEGDAGSDGCPANPTRPPGRALDELKERMLKLRKPIEEAMNRNDWRKACELYVEKINLAEQMLDFAHREDSQEDIRNCQRGLELYRETYSQLTAEANHPTLSSCALPPEPEPEERDVTKAGQNEFARLLRCPMAI
jgi:Protein of unknown function (DUF4236)